MRLLKIHNVALNLDHVKFIAESIPEGEGKCRVIVKWLEGGEMNIHLPEGKTLDDYLPKSITE